MALLAYGSGEFNKVDFNDDSLTALGAYTAIADQRSDVDMLDELERTYSQLADENDLDLLWSDADNTWIIGSECA